MRKLLYSGTNRSSQTQRLILVVKDEELGVEHRPTFDIEGNDEGIEALESLILSAQGCIDNIRINRGEPAKYLQ